MSAGADERLVVMLEARISEFEKRMAKAERTGTTSYTRLRRGSSSATRQMETDMVRSSGRINQAMASISSNIGAFGKAFAVGAITTGLGMAAREARNTVREIAQVGDEAKRAGMSAEGFQEWGYVAKQNRIGIDALTDGFKELSLRADEFVVTGGGSAAEAFARLGFTAAELKTKLKDPSALMLEIIGRLEGLDKAAQIRIADELFGGTGGEQFVQLLDKGEAGISAQIARARDLGIVMDSDMIAKAAELDAKFREVESRLQSMWRTGVVEAGYYFGMIERERERLTFDKDLTSRVVGDDVANALADLPEVPQTALASIEAMKREYVELASEARRLVPALSDASNMLRGVGNEAGAQTLTDLATRIGDAARAFEDGTITGEEYADRLREVVTEAENSIAAMGELDQARLGDVIGQVQSLLEWIGLLPGAARAARDEIAGIALMDTGTPLSGSGQDLLPPGPGQMATSPRPKPAPNDPDFGLPGTPKAPAGGGGGGRSRDDFEAAMEATRQEILLLEAETAAFISAAEAGGDYAGASDYARKKAELLMAAQKQGLAITPELTAEIEEQARAFVTAGLEAEAAADRIKQLEAVSEKGRDALGGIFEAMIDGSASAKDAIASLLIEIAKMQFKKGMFSLLEAVGGEGVFGLVGGLLGFDQGGYTGDGARKEPKGVVHGGEYVFSQKSVRRLGLPLLEALHRGLPGYELGGMVPGCEGGPEIIMERKPA